MNKKEQEAVESIRSKIKAYSISTKVKEAVSKSSGQFVKTQYNNGETEIVDVEIEKYLCKLSPYYFIYNYCFIDFPGIGIVPFDLYYFQKEILKEVNNYKKLIFLKTRQCLIKDNFVMTDRGYISIKDVKIGDKIETIINDNIAFVNVENSFYVGKRKICHILINSGLTIDCTLDHKIFTKRGWVEAKKLTIKDEIISIVNKGKFGDFELSNDELDILFNDRCLTNELMNLNEKQMSILLNRLYAGDGWITYKKDKRRPNYIQYEIGLGSPCYKLIKQIEYILQTKYGIHCYIMECFDKKNKNGKRFWKLRISQKKSVMNFINKIGIKGKTDNKNIIDLISKENPYRTNQNFEKIRKIICKEKTYDVYDITTESSDFLTNGLLVHNCGISTLFSLYCLWRCLFHESESIDVVSLKQDKAQGFVNKMDATLNRLPSFLSVPITSQSQKRIRFANNSIIVSEPASPRAGRSDTLSLLVLDEAAHYLSEKLVRGIVAAAQPTLTRTGGDLIIVSCLTENTYIFTNKGMQQIGDFIPEKWNYGYNKIDNFLIDGLKKQQKCNDFYISGLSNTIKITTKNKYEIEGTLIHPLMVFTKKGKMEWKKMKNLRKGDLLLIKKGSQTFGNFKEVNFKYRKEVHNGRDFIVKEIDKELAYLFGIYLAEGYIYTDNKKQYKLQIAVTEEDIKNKVRAFANKYNFHITESKTQFTISSKGIVKFFEHIGFNIYNRSSTKNIPKKLLQMPKILIAEMLRGMFDGDGCNNYKASTIDYASSSYEMIKQIKIILLNFGVKTKTIQNKRTKVYSLSITKDRIKFLKEIGFCLKRKQNYKICNYNRDDSYRVKQLLINEALNKKISLKQLASNGCDLYNRKSRKNSRSLGKSVILKAIDVIKSNALLDLRFILENDFILEEVFFVEKKQNITYDFTINETHSFIANGILSSNTPNSLAGPGAYYAEQVDQLRTSGNNETNKLIEIGWYEVLDLDGIKPYKGYNNVLEKYIKRDYYNNTKVKKEMIKFFEPIAEDWKSNPWLKKQHDDLGDREYKQEILHSFIVSGSQVFNDDILLRIKAEIKEPISKDVIGKTKLNGFWIWRKPIPGHRYILAVDVATGTGQDTSSMEIMDVENYEQVAEYKGYISTPAFSRAIRKIALYYNESFVVIECNGIGEAIFNGVYYDENEPYNNVYKQKKTKNNITRMTGWITEVKSRKLITNELIDWLSVDELWNELKLYSERIYNEAITWIWTTRPEHEKGTHDDILIALALAIYHRDKAISTSESFLITEKGDLLEYESKDNVDEFVNESDFEFIMGDADYEDEFQKKHGCSLEQYKWLIKKN